MELIALASHQSLITDISDEVLDLANILDIPSHTEHTDDHLYIIDNVEKPSIGSFIIRNNNDVLITAKVFNEILLDIASGMTLLEAFNKQGFTF